MSTTYILLLFSYARFVHVYAYIHLYPSINPSYFGDELQSKLQASVNFLLNTSALSLIREASGPLNHLTSMTSGPQMVSRPTFISKFIGERETIFLLFFSPRPRAKADSQVFLLPSFCVGSKFYFFL